MVKKNDDTQHPNETQNGEEAPEIKMETLADIAALGKTLEAPALIEAESTNTAELLPTLTIIRNLALPVMPESKSERSGAAWNDATLKSVSEAGAAVLDKHGLSMGDMMGQYGVYIALAASLAPPVLTTVQVWKEPEPTPPKAAPLPAPTPPHAATLPAYKMPVQQVNG